MRVLTDRGTEFCGIADAHPYELYLAIRRHRAYEDEGAATATNGICERFHKTWWCSTNDHRDGKKFYTSLDELRSTSTRG